jgi:hypothetical protein
MGISELGVLLLATILTVTTLSGILSAGAPAPSDDISGPLHRLSDDPVQLTSSTVLTPASGGAADFLSRYESSADGEGRRL